MPIILNSGSAVTTVDQLNAALTTAAGEAANSGVYEIDLGSDTLDLTNAPGIDLQPGVTLDIAGNGYTIGGAGSLSLNGAGDLQIEAMDTATGGAVINGGTLELTVPNAIGTVSFAGWTGELLVDASAGTFSAPVSGFAYGDTIDLAGVAPSSVSLANGTLMYAGGSFALGRLAGSYLDIGSDGAGGALLTASNTLVMDEDDLNAAILAAAAVVLPGTQVIEIGGDITLGAALNFISLAAGVTLDIEGNGFSLDGGGTQRGLFVYAGSVTVENLALDDMLAIGSNGRPNGGGGGAGLGGGLFIGSNVTGDAGAVTLSGVSFAGDGAQGGGIGYVGVSRQSAGGLVPYSAAWGTYGEGGGGSYGIGGSGGAGGFGGGPSLLGNIGGDGLGAGGDIFVQQGASLTIAGGTLGAGTVAGGVDQLLDVNTPSYGYGDGMFIQGNQTVAFAPGAGQAVTISGVIADQSGSGGTDSNAGAGGLLMNGPGKLVLDADNTFSGGIVLNSGTLEIAAAGAGGLGFIRFGSGAAELIIDPAAQASFANVVEDFTSSDTLVLPGATNLSYDRATDTLSFTNGTDPSLTLTPGPNQVLAINGAEITASLACFAEGTRIATPGGEIPVEALQSGDLVLTASGAVRQVRWIGYRHLDLVRHRQPSLAKPVRIRAHAFGPDRPVRDLLVSPAHAVFYDGMLIPADMLVNGASVVREMSRTSITYYHVELDRHDVLLSENLPTESYLDTGNRAMFANADLPVTLHPDMTNDPARRVAESCAPFVDDPATVEPLWRMLATRAAELGWTIPPQPPTTRDPDLCLMADEKRLAPVSVHNGRYTFVIPGDPRVLRLLSRSAVPSEAMPPLADHRRLGVMLSRLTWRRGSDVVPVALDHPDLVQGWWGAEWHNASRLVRWTDGNAWILSHRESGGPWLLEVEISQTMDYILPTAEFLRAA